MKKYTHKKIIIYVRYTPQNKKVHKCKKIQETNKNQTITSIKTNKQKQTKFLKADNRKKCSE